MTSFVQDVRYAVRKLRATPGFTAIAIATLALGIGVNFAVFAVVSSVVLTPLPYPHPDRLMMLWETKSARDRDTNVVNPQNYLDWRDRAKSFEGLAALTWSEMTLTGSDPEIVAGRAVTPNFFRVLSVSPRLGRTFTPAEARTDGPGVVVISDGLWRRRFGADPAIVGRSVAIAAGSVVVLGVMPPSMGRMPWGEEEYWEPLRLQETDRVRHGRYALVVGRLRPGVTREQAAAEMVGIAKAVEKENPDFDAGWSVRVVSLTDQIVGSARTALFVLLGAVTLVLLIACANVANLLIGRALGRRREAAVRAALGASRLRLIRESLIENVVLALAGGSLGILLAHWAVGALVTARPSGVPRLAEIGISTPVLAAATAVSLIAGILFGVLASPRETTLSVSTALRPGNGFAHRGFAGFRFRGGLVVAQVSMALILLAGAGLLIRSVEKLMSVDPGFDPANLLTVRLDLPETTYASAARKRDFFDRVLDRVRAFPSVKAAGAVSLLPVGGEGVATTFTAVGQPTPGPGDAPVADIRIADPEYFRTMRIPILRGRSISRFDSEKATPVIVINETLASSIWPGDTAIGKRLKISLAQPDAEVEIVGVAANVRLTSLEATVRPTIYYPFAQLPIGSMTLVIRQNGDTQARLREIRTAVREIDPEIPVRTILTMDSRLAESISDRRYPMLLLAVFAGLALLLAAIGLYGVLSYAVARRTRELGIRSALGATRSDVIRLVLREGGRLVAAGIAIGVGAALASTRMISSLLFGVEPTDPVTLAVVASLLAGVALLACYFPARRATKVDPMVALRTE